MEKTADYVETLPAVAPVLPLVRRTPA